MLELLWNAPLSEASMDRCLSAIELPTGARVLDVGCGCGEVLIRLHERHGLTGMGVDTSAACLEEARRRAVSRILYGALEFVLADVTVLDLEREAYGLALCLGASHAFGHGPHAFGGALERLAELVEPGGLILIADKYLKQPAPPEYRRLLGPAPPDDQTHAANVMTGAELGLTALGAWTSCDQEWDDYEWARQRVVEGRAARRRKHAGVNGFEGAADDATADTESVARALAKRRAWMAAYLRHGRHTLGYGVYLFKKGDNPPPGADN
ncbi:Demethylrebeccamycin-D-glucose O-methyltransferase [Pseudobythopirellula maris]|uniref:Demethylrebeccamycin-D-glucose O-methyltransferase n=1 Tax=Pseudobythopirellula maris TaxID=2527991 RepID=A0A5C5ZN35_9BACT|nr:class I SAM-dependent methyltransferase [Pseudobythopirellula maris]TWT88892.1 Demethylrebeccamycin-D-glucose O-methyltransferase [Pseudobythopirellula maris]